MARSFSNARLFYALVDGVSVSVNRRSYSTAAAAAASVRGGGAMGGMGKRGGGGEERGKMNERTEISSSWVPDPVTGYYRPENRGAEIDVAELREMVLNNRKMRQQH
ncbi:PREDICTED: late embryogenesis abundant protein Lea5-D-like [Nelumbo nucifera]|uniref:Late embryogenesis abundant protein Lea5-D-like n=1 Tax=Nelumbo nucifera TaxID=4432 RepID=A0A1U8B1Y0_NELNU|nr:PREDICTED: late embryogenesis abundant protein Lea5-D-like [Nelumbo nucifera]